MSGHDPYRTCLGRALIGLAMLCCLTLPAVASTGDAEEAAGPITARSYEVRYRSLAEAVDLVGAILSPDGTVSIRPGLRRLVVRDREQILDQVGDLLESFDLPPRNVEISVVLVMGSDSRDAEAGRHTPDKSITREHLGVLETLREFWKWTELDPIGSRSVTAMEGSTVSADLAEGYRISFEVEGVVTRGGREIVTLDDFVLQRVARNDDGGEETRNLHTVRITVPAGQQSMVAVARSPNAERMLLLMVKAEPR
jgi:hypothetical protein